MYAFVSKHLMHKAITIMCQAVGNRIFCFYVYFWGKKKHVNRNVSCLVSLTVRDKHTDQLLKLLFCMSLHLLFCREDITSLIRPGRNEFRYLLNCTCQNSGLGSGTRQHFRWWRERVNKNRDKKRGVHSCCRTDTEFGALPLPAAYTCCFR